MLKKFLLLFNTIRYLKPVQLRYQLYYKIKAPFIKFIPYNKYAQQPIVRLAWESKDLICYGGKFDGTSGFTFLNLSKNFYGAVDWNYQGHGKLWNYNLQYFDYLHDDTINDTVKQKLIDDFSTKLLDHQIPPEPYPVSLRLINWILYYSKTGYSSAIFLRALRYQVHYLECNLEYHILANHFLENLIALSIASLGLQDEKLSNKVFSRLLAQLDEQVFPDGGHYERSPMYHCIILSRLLLLYELLVKNKPGSTYINRIKTCIEAMLGWLEAFSYSNGTYALVNDSTNDIAPGKKTITQAATLNGLHAKSLSLGKSGFRKYKGEHYEAIVDAGNISPQYQPGHTHSGMLAFSLQYKGKDIIVDTGISTYNNDETRAQERSTKAHSTVVINGQNQYEVWSAFRVAKRARLTILEEDGQSFTGYHDGYREQQLTHQRQFSFNKHSILISDELIVPHNKKVQAEAFLHFDYSISKPTLKKDKIILGESISIIFKAFHDIALLPYHQPVGFNKFENAYCIKVSFENNLTTQIALT